MAKTVRRVEIGSRVVLVVGTAHISRESVEEVTSIIETEKPGRVCVEIDEARFRSMTGGSDWESLDVARIIKEGKGFFLLANLALASFQRRLGAGVDVKPGEDMIAAVRAAEGLGIPYSFCDRDVQITLRRAWTRCGVWSKAKLLASLVSGAVTNEKLSAEEIERLKQGSELDDMMRELSDYLPKVKEVLIDERDRYLAARIWESREPMVVAVVGAGHVEGIAAWLARFESGEATTDTSTIDFVPPPSVLSKVAGWLVPALIVGLIGLGFARSGAEVSLALILRWVLLNGSLAAFGAALCLAHPLSILVAFLGAPIATLNPFVGVGLFSGLVEAVMRKPMVRDFERLNEDIGTVRGFYRNRVTHILLVFFLSSLGGAIGNFIALPFLAGGAV
ncbi:MAG: TraB/GumN family protein [Spirochaetes bacterium]|nr:TraB/GumN family protein [Spirochaetota bacterium]